MTADLLIEGGLIVTMDSNCRIVENGFLTVEEGRIASVGSTQDKRPQANSKIDARRKVVLPGLVSAHTHMYGVLAHGIPIKEAPKDFKGFLEDFWWPNVENRLGKKEIKVATRVACIEMAKTGTTAFGDILEAPSSIPGALDLEGEVVREVGLRGILSFEATQRVSEKNARLGVDENLRFVKKWNKTKELTKGMHCTHTLFTCSKDFLKEVRDIANGYPAGIHIHLEEGAYEKQFSVKKYGKLPAEVYDDIGYLRPDLLASQCVHTEDREIQLFKKRGVRVAHIPLSNCEVGGGIAPVKTFLDNNLSVGLGTDGYKVDMFEVMRATFLIHKGYLQDASVMPAKTVMKMATRGGATALGIGDQVGSIEVGKRADIIIVDPKLPTPVNADNVWDQLVVFTDGKDVETVIVDGKLVVDKRRIVRVDETQAWKECNRAAEKFWDGLR